jgi:hypothetical protein
VEQYVDKQDADMLTQEDLREENRRRREEREREQQSQTGTDPTVDFSPNPDYSGGYTDIPEDQQSPTNTVGDAADVTDNSAGPSGFIGKY